MSKVITALIIADYKLTEWVRQRRILLSPNRGVDIKSWAYQPKTIVDYFFTLVQQELQQTVLDTNYRNSMSNINTHFKNMAQN